MSTAVLEDRLTEQIETKTEISSTEENVYQGNRVSAAAQFAWDIVRYNQECMKNPAETRKFYGDSLIGRLKDNLDQKSSFVLDALAPSLCYLTAINSFIYALFALKYFGAEKAYILK